MLRSVVETSDESLTGLCGLPTALAASAWDDVFSSIVVPCLGQRHPRALPDRPERLPNLWHARPEAAAELCAILLKHGDTATYINRLIDQGADVEPLYAEVFEPAARCLGDLWDDDQCDEFSVTLAMGQLQVEVRRLRRTLIRDDYATRPGHAVLVAPQPGEPHGLSATLCSELFERDGWDVSCAFPRTDAFLNELLHDRWFDVLDLSLSGALCRDRQLHAMRLTIRAAQAASLNPALAVVVDGRTFFEQPLAFLMAGADVGCGRLMDTVPAAEHLLQSIVLRRGLAGR
jgi:MerR family transcriptional regulator, light-induced transcriptional regulator